MAPLPLSAKGGISSSSSKVVVDGLVRSYGPQTLRIYRMGPELGPPALEERAYGTEDLSWSANRLMTLKIAQRMGIPADKFQLDFFGEQCSGFARRR